MNKNTKKLLDSFTKPICKNCNEELELFAFSLSDDSKPIKIIDAAGNFGGRCINEKCSHRFKTVRIDNYQ